MKTIKDFLGLVIDYALTGLSIDPSTYKPGPDRPG